MGFLPLESKAVSTYLLGGQTYHIAVATRPYDEWTGLFNLYLGATATNDMLASATVLFGG
jgi:hypothetical protein